MEYWTFGGKDGAREINFATATDTPPLNEFAGKIRILPRFDARGAPSGLTAHQISVFIGSLPTRRSPLIPHIRSGLAFTRRLIEMHLSKPLWAILRHWV